MLKYLIRRLLLAIPTIVVISMILFLIIDLGPGDPASQLPLTIPAEIREQMRDALGANDAIHIKYLKWAKLMFVNEPVNLFESLTNTCLGECETRPRILSWASRSAALDVVAERMPQTLWVMGLSLLFGVLLAIPVGIYSAYRQYSWFDNVGTVVTMLGYSVPTFFTGLLAIVVFSVKLDWFPSFYKTTHDVDFSSWSSIWFQIKQLVMPVAVLTAFNAAQLSRFTRSAVLDNLSADYVRTARSKGLRERAVVLVHILRNSLIPVVTLIAISIPNLFGGAIITEQIFRINGLGALLVTSAGNGDLPMVQSLAFIFSVLVVVFNLIADALYGMLDPRIRYDT